MEPKQQAIEQRGCIANKPGRWELNKHYGRSENGKLEKPGTPG